MHLKSMKVVPFNLMIKHHLRAQATDSSEQEVCGGDGEASSLPEQINPEPSQPNPLLRADKNQELVWLRDNAPDALVAQVSKITSMLVRNRWVRCFNALDNEEFAIECRKGEHQALITSLGIGINSGPVISSRDKGQSKRSGGKLSSKRSVDWPVP